MKENLKTSDGIDIHIVPKEENSGPIVIESEKGTRVQYRADSLQDVFLFLSGLWTAYFGEEESASLLNQFIGNR